MEEESIYQHMFRVKSLFFDLTEKIKAVLSCITENKVETDEFRYELNSFIEDYSQLLKEEDHLIENILMLIRDYEEQLPRDVRASFRFKIDEIKRLIKRRLEEDIRDQKAVIHLDKKI